MASSSQNSNTAQQSQTSPWLPAQPGLSSALSFLQGINPTATGAQNTAANNLISSTNGLPNFGGAASGVTSGLLGGDPTGILSTLRSNLSPIASADLDPTKTPGIQNLLQTIQQQVHNSIGGQFAAAGRDMSPAANTAEAYGLSQGLAAPLLNQYNQNVSNVLGANSALGGVAGAMTGNQQAGLGAAAQQPGIAMAPALAQLQAASTKYNLPLSNLSGIESLMLPIAGLGGQSSGTAQGTTTYNPSALQIASAIGGGNGIFPGLGNKVLGAGLGMLGG